MLTSNLILEEESFNSTTCGSSYNESPYDSSLDEKKDIPGTIDNKKSDLKRKYIRGYSEL
jgi:hypothetical protein